MTTKGCTLRGISASIKRYFIYFYAAHRAIGGFNGDPPRMEQTLITLKRNSDYKVLCRCVSVMAPKKFKINYSAAPGPGNGWRADL